MPDELGASERQEKRLRTSDGKKNLIGDRVREQRKKARLTSDQLAAAIQLGTEGEWAIGTQEIYKLERGLRAVTDIELTAIARALGCSPCYLLTGAGDDIAPAEA